MNLVVALSARPAPVFSVVDNRYSKPGLCPGFFVEDALASAIGIVTVKFLWPAQKCFDNLKKLCYHMDGIDFYMHFRACDLI